MAKTPVPSDDQLPDDAAPGSTVAKSPSSRSPRTPTQPTVPPKPTVPSVQPTVQPTEQLPLEAPPVSASAAASGGATGLDSSASTATPGTAGKQPSVFRRHPLATAIAAGVIAVVVVSGLTACGVGSAVTASLTSSNSSAMSMPTSTATPAPAAGGAAKGGTASGTRLAFRATIQSMSGETWTILTRKGQTVTVSVTSATQFGTKKSAETASSFSVGDSIIIVATRGSDGTPTATRVVTSPQAGAAPVPSATPSAAPNT